MTCMMTANTTSATATLRARQRRPAVIIESQSRQERRSSCAANQVSEPAWLMRQVSCPGRSATARYARWCAADPGPRGRKNMGAGTAAHHSAEERSALRCARDTRPDMTRPPSRRLRLLGDEREERVLQARVAAALRARLVAQLVERALRDQPPLRDHADAVGHALGDLEDMRGHDDGAARGDALAQHGLDLARRAGVEAGERLVEDDHLGVVPQR